MGTDRGGGSGAGPHRRLSCCCPVLSCHICCILTACPCRHLVVVVALSSHGSFVVWWLVVGVSGVWSWTCLCGCPFVHCGPLSLLGHLSMFGHSSSFVGGRLHCMGSRGLSLALRVSWLAIVVFLCSVICWWVRLGWKAHQSMMNDESVICRLVAMSLTVTWHLEWALARGTDRDDLLCRMTMLRVVTVRQHRVVGVIGRALWMVVVVEEEPCGLLIAPKSSISICQRSLWV